MLTEQQLKERKKYIGGSDVAAILGKSKYKTPLEVFLEKTSDEIPPQIENDPIYFGNALEDFVAKEFEKRSGKKVYEFPDTVYDKEHPFLAANVDRAIYGEDAILECKTAGLRSAHLWGDEDSDEIPTQYLLQCVHYARVLNKSKVYIAVLIGGQSFRIFEYERNTALENKVVDKLCTFWEHNVLKNYAPDPSNYKEITKIFKNAKNTSVLADIEIINQVREYNDLSVKIGSFKEKQEELKEKICFYMGENEILLDRNDNKVASWKCSQTTKLNKKLLFDEVENAEKFYYKTDVRRFLPKKGY